ncbi:MAG TPA: hypothetical protein VNM72_05810 [Blastocatellia bacterium]|nr:hypothetical protein [Blastocatellia bacterium]
MNEAICKGCGTSMATCPKKAIYVWHFRPEQLLAEVKSPTDEKCQRMFYPLETFIRWRGIS